MKPKFFKNSDEFRKWLGKNHNSSKEIWVGLYKGRSSSGAFSQKEAVDQALCFGWIYGVIKRIDDFSYAIRFTPRKPKSSWSAGNLKRAQELIKIGRMHKAGIQALRGRDKEASEETPPAFSPDHLKRFTANKKAWNFFVQQTASYRRYMILWVVKAKKEETRLRRLQMLIDDSARGSKLTRIIKANEKLKKVYEPGRTPVETGRNLGPVSAGELRTIGVETLEQLQSLGWEKAFLRLCETYPNRLHMTMLLSLVGAVEDQDWRKIDPELKAEAKAVLYEARESLRRD